LSLSVETIANSGFAVSRTTVFTCGMPLRSVMLAAIGVLATARAPHHHRMFART
jgi:hypothetical protein